jgi:hypothetical protein
VKRDANFATHIFAREAKLFLMPSIEFGLKKF